MSTTRTCPKCGEQLPPDAPRDVCPVCLLGLLAAGEGGATTRLDAETPVGGEHQPQPARRVFGDYELLEEIARGGMGVVYKARQLSLGRNVAVKMILAGQFAGKQVAQRFKSEAIAAAVLQHPNIVAVHEVGVHEGQHFFSMDYVEGQNLAQLVGNRPLPAAHAARYVKIIAEAIHYAHQQGILHRDLKPSNVLVDAASDQPQVTDFGLAKRLVGERCTASTQSMGGQERDIAEHAHPDSLTVTGQVLGSPNFMPPEQARGSRGGAGRHSDVYGLGGILYYLLTARAPFQAESLEAIVTQVIDTEPISPRLLNPAVPRDLETICLKCLEKEPAKRYASAQELVEELDRFLRDEPIHARPVTRVERALRWCRRKPALAATLAALQAVFVAGFMGILWQWQRAEHNARGQTRERLRAEQQLYVADINRAYGDIERGEITRAREHLEKYSPKPGEPDLRGLEWRLLWPLVQSKSDRVLFQTNAALRAAVFSPDGAVLAIGGEMNSVALIDVAGGRLVRVLTNVPGRIDLRGLAFSPNGKFFAALSGSTLHVWRADTWEEVTRPLPGQDNASWLNCSVDFSSDSSVLAARTPTNAVAFWSTASWELMATLRGSDRFGSLIHHSPDGRWIAIADQDILQIRDARSLNLVTNLSRGAPESMASLNRFLSMAWSGNLLAAGCRDGALVLWATDTWRELGRCKPVKNFLTALAFSPDGGVLAVAEERETIRLLDVAALRSSMTRSSAPRPIASITGGASTFAVSFSRDGKALLSAGADGRVHYWPHWPRRRERVLRGSLDVVGFTADSHYIACLHRDTNTTTLHKWRVETMEDMGQVGPPLADPAHQPCALSPDGNTMAVGRNGDVQLWDVAENRLWKVLPGEHTLTPPLQFSPSGRRLAAVSWQPDRLDTQVWDVQSGAVIQRVEDTQSSFAFSGDDQLFAVAMRDRVHIYNASGHVRWLAAGYGRLHGLDFSPGGDLLAIHAPQRGQILICRTRSGEMEASFPLNHTMSSSVFSRDGRTLISRDVDGSLTFWNLATRQSMFTLPRLNTFTFLRISPDGNTLAFKADADEDPANEVELWTAPTMAEIDAR